MLPYDKVDTTASESIINDKKNASAKLKNKNIMIAEPEIAIKTADLKIHSAWKIFLLPKALAVAPLIAPPKAPLDNILVSIKIGKI